MKLYICQTLDGYIARSNGDISFLEQFDSEILNSPNLGIRNTYQDFISTFENVVEGYTTYKQIDEMGYGNQYSSFNHYVLTRNNQATNDENVTEFLDFDKLEELNLNPETTFLVGGSQVIREAFKRKLVSTVILTHLPVFLGDGIKLFDNIESDVNIQIVNIINDNRFYQVEYKIDYEN